MDGQSHLAVQEDLSTTNDVSSSIFNLCKEESGQTALPDLELDNSTNTSKVLPSEGAEHEADIEDEDIDDDDDVFHPSPLPPPKPENDSCKTTVITTTNSTTTQPTTLDPLAESYRVIPNKTTESNFKAFFSIFKKDLNYLLFSLNIFSAVRYARVPSLVTLPLMYSKTL